MMQKIAKHFGSTVALIVGIADLASSARPESGQGQFVAGVVMILGALAYRSAKKRMLGEVRSTALRQVIEVGAIVLAVLAVVLQNDYLKMRIATDPFPNLIIPLWAVVAYFIMSIRAELQRRIGAEAA